MDRSINNEISESSNSSKVEFYSLAGDIPEEEKD